MQFGKRSVCDFALEVSRFEVAAREKGDEIGELATALEIELDQVHDFIAEKLSV